MGFLDDIKAIQLGLNVFRKITFRQYAVPTKPTPNLVHLYAKDDGLLYSMDDTGAETQVSGGAGSGLSEEDTKTLIRSYQILMQDGVTSPPVPVETEAGDDWLYTDI